MNALRLISTDFDGTLFAEFENPPIPHHLQQLLRELQAGGAKWVINTGREMASLMEAIARAQLQAEPDYLVLVEREIHLRQDAQFIALEPWNSRCSQLHRELFAPLHPDLPRLIRWIESRFHARIYEDLYSPLCLVASNVSDMDQIQQYLEDYSRSVPNLSVVRNDVYARFCHSAYNKGTALGELMRLLSVTPQEVFVIGDHLNDLPMLSPDIARCLAAPANAIEAVRARMRQLGGYISPRPHGHGVADAIKYYLAGQGA